MQQVKTNDPLKIKAADWNEIGRVVESYRNMAHNLLAAGSRQALPPGVVWVRNPYDGPRYERSAIVLGASEILPPAADFFSGPPIFAGLPVMDAALPWALYLDPVNPGQLGRAMLSGVTACAAVIRSTSHRFVSPIRGDLTGALESGDSGARLLWATGSAGLQYCLVQMGGGAGGSGYRGYFTLFDSSFLERQNDGTIVTRYRVTIADGATWNGATGGQSRCRVNNITFYLPPTQSPDLSSGTTFLLHFRNAVKATGDTPEQPATVTIETADNLPPDTATDCYYQLGRALFSSAGMTIVQDHVTGVPQMFFYLLCGEGK